jgi:hypothetical protein
MDYLFGNIYKYITEVGFSQFPGKTLVSECNVPEKGITLRGQAGNFRHESG